MSGGPRAGREAPARAPHRVVRGRRDALGLERRAAAEDRRAARRLRPLQREVMERMTAPVRGMHCAACVGKVERALASVPGVESASVNLATEQAAVVFDPARTDLARLRAAVAAAGYELAEARPDRVPGEAVDRVGPWSSAPARRVQSKFVVL